jgi:hypothetical protein
MYLHGEVLRIALFGSISSALPSSQASNCSENKVIRSKVMKHSLYYTVTCGHFGQSSG